ncbi:unnamed protein product [Prunus armeniaca]|uniref:Uncharacterized protein n=1 Tax=Prunus armeniaca TaxID=36596 RepID=A0A6J5UMV0_PRUAR|nr:unnamed protein product [Prunus armeniaca]CAB4308274.1 unnamed protein product [Prunus armeniaca]
MYYIWKVSGWVWRRLGRVGARFTRPWGLRVQAVGDKKIQWVVVCTEPLKNGAVLANSQI